jgi:probable rRNA maturation factor
VSVSFHTEEIFFELDQKLRHKQWIKEWISQHSKIPGSLSFVFTSNERIKLINQEYLNHNYFTDVISFDYTDKDVISGDIFISMEEVKKNADFYEAELYNELRRVMIHGVTHLLGYKDGSEEEKEIMRKKENEALHLWLKLV